MLNEKDYSGKEMIDITLDKELCDGPHCGKCTYVCPNNVFSVQNNKVSVTSPTYCKKCQECIKICPKAALNIKLICLVNDYEFEE
jgi:NAD-dependent dihydropyrimidine dehydrogenase PreA subunit